MLFCITPSESEKYRVIYDYCSGRSKDLEARNGDIVKVLTSNSESNWCKAQNLRTKKRGLIPWTFITPRNDTPESQPGYFNIKSGEAILKLMVPSISCGTYIIRPSQDRTNLALSVKYKKTPNEFDVFHHKIYITANSFYIFPKNEFKKLADLLKYYTENQELKVRLENPYVVVCYIPPTETFQIPKEEIELKNCIATGLFGNIYLGIWCKKLKITVKVIEDDLSSLDDIKREISIIQKLHHPYILSLLGVCLEGTPIYLITEYMSNGNIKDYLSKTSPELCIENQLIQNIYQIAQGMKYLISKSIIHRDLRAENILVSSDLTAKIGEFSLARIVTDDIYTDRTTTVMYPMKWAAPEILIKGNIFTEKTDVWSFGVTCYEIMFRGKDPYGDESPLEIMEKVKVGYALKYLETLEMNNIIKNLMKECWQTDEKKRPNFVEIVEKLKRSCFPDDITL